MATKSAKGNGTRSASDIRRRQATDVAGIKKMLAQQKAGKSTKKSK